MKKAPIHSDYLRRVVDTKELKKVVRQVVATIKESKLQFDFIAFRGMSGGLVAPLVAVRMNKHILMVRKDSSHGYSVEGWAGGGNYIIIDDFISRGVTVNTIIEKIGEFSTEHKITSTPIGVFLWKRGEDRNEDFGKLTLPVYGCDEKEQEGT